MGSELLDLLPPDPRVVPDPDYDSLYLDLQSLRPLAPRRRAIPRRCQHFSFRLTLLAENVRADFCLDRIRRDQGSDVAAYSTRASNIPVCTDPARFNCTMMR